METTELYQLSRVKPTACLAMARRYKFGTNFSIDASIGELNPLVGLKRLRKIEIKTKGLSKQLFSGEYHSAFKGRGMSFSEVRSYQYGDRTISEGVEYDSTPSEGTAKAVSKNKHNENCTDSTPSEGTAKAVSKNKHNENCTDSTPSEGTAKAVSKNKHNENCTDSAPSEGTAKAVSKSKQSENCTDSAPSEGTAKAVSKSKHNENCTDSAPSEGTAKAVSKSKQSENCTDSAHNS